PTAGPPSRETAKAATRDIDGVQMEGPADRRLALCADIAPNWSSRVVHLTSRILALRPMDCEYERRRSGLSGPYLGISKLLTTYAFELRWTTAHAAARHEFPHPRTEFRERHGDR